MTGARPLVVVDVETSGMRPAHDRVLSVAAVELDGHGAVRRQFASLVNPGVDPGPVHVHGLTPARLAGAPRFAEVAAQLAELLAGGTVLAHNAVFDVSFLAAEYARAGLDNPIGEYACTLDYAGRVHVSSADLKLGTLAAHLGVAQHAAHDALDDALVLAGVVTALRPLAERKGVALPVRDATDLVADPATGMLRSRAWAEALAAPRPWRPAGRLRRGGPLVQGMEAVVTPDLDVDCDPDALAARLVAAGVYVAERLGARTSFAVCDATGVVRGRAAFARRKGLELVGSAQVAELLADVRPGRPVAGVQVPEEDTLF